MNTTQLRVLRQSLLLSGALALSMWGTVWAIGETPTEPWKVQPAASSLTFNTTKSGTTGVGGVTETMRFTRYEGGVDARGRVQLKIDLSSIDSGIPLRDERMQSLLWRVGRYPSVTFSGQLPAGLAQPEGLKEPMALELVGQLDMAGQSQPVKAQLQITPAQGKVWVSTRSPILIRADDFGLTPGVEALRAVMGLSYLSSTVPVTFSLELTPARSASESPAPSGASVRSLAW